MRTEGQGIPAREISAVTEKGITLKDGTTVDFAVSAEIWGQIHADGDARCVGDRDAERLSFTFYALPNPVTVCFLGEGWLARTLLRRRAYRRFYDLQCRIVAYGYQTYDMT